MPSFPVQFVGPSYTLANRKADTQRTVNMYLRKVESGSGKAQYILKSVEGLTAVTTSGDTISGEFQGSGVIPESEWVNELAVFVNDGKFYAISPAGTVTEFSLGSMRTTGRVGVEIGRTHILITGDYDYYYDINAATTTLMSGETSQWAVYLAGRFILQDSSRGDRFIWTEIDDPSTIDALNYATAESAPDGIVRGIEYRQELWLLGFKSIEVWRPSDSVDAAFEKNNSVSISVGCSACYSVVKADNSLFWIGQDDNGGGVVYMAQGYQPRRISNHALEEALSTSTNMRDAYAFVYQYGGHVFVCFQVPGLSTTWCWDTNTETWTERAELVAGEFAQWDAEVAFYASGVNYIGRQTKVCSIDPDVYTWDGDTICRERTSPHYAIPSQNFVFYSRLRLDCTVGTGDGNVQLYYSDDGGHLWTASALERSLGGVGERRTTVQWNRLGRARDRAWRIRCTDAILFDIVNVDVQATEGSS